MGQKEIDGWGVTSQEGVDTKHRAVDAVVSHAVLGVVECPYALRSVACSHKRSAHHTASISSPDVHHPRAREHKHVPLTFCVCARIASRGEIKADDAYKQGIAECVMTHLCMGGSLTVAGPILLLEALTCACCIVCITKQ